MLLQHSIRLLLIYSLHIVTISTCSAFTATRRILEINTPTNTKPPEPWRLFSLKPAAIPLMDSGKALARSGELLIDITANLDLYGGALSAAGAQIRNAGDCVAQAAASCRFKTATELVGDELREAATCLQEAADKLKLAADEAKVDQLGEFVTFVEATIEPTKQLSQALEAAGAGVMMRREGVEKIGVSLAKGGTHLQTLASCIEQLDKRAAESAQRMVFAATKMIEAGNNLQGIVPKTTGKSWLKGGM